MASLTVQAMRSFLSSSIATRTTNERAIRNKLYGLLAEVHLRNYLGELGFAERVSGGGWIARRVGAGDFAHNTTVFFPEMIVPGTDYDAGRALPIPHHGLHTICATFRQTGIIPLFCAAVVQSAGDPLSVRWRSVELGLPTEQPYNDFP